MAALRWGLPVSLLSLVLACPAGGDALSLTPASSSAAALQPIVLSVDLSALDSRPGLHFTIALPDSGAMIDSILTVGRAAGLSGLDYEIGPNAVSVIAFDATGPGAIAAGTGPVVELHLRLDGAVGDTLRFDLTGGLLADAAYAQVLPSLAGAEVVLSEQLSVGDPGQPHVSVPREFSLAAARPNPARTGSIFEYSLPVASKVELRIFDLAGRLVRSLVDARQEAGVWSVRWDGRGDHGHRVPSGIYFYRLHAGGFAATRQMVVMGP